jgi:hypothetical protein
LLDNLAAALAEKGIADLSARSLRLFRQFSLVYPDIWQSLIAKSGTDALPVSTRESLIAKSGGALFTAATRKSGARRHLGVDGPMLVSRLVYSSGGAHRD